MGDQVAQLLASGDYESLSLALMVGLAGVVFVAMMWLRLFRWVFALFGVKV